MLRRYLDEGQPAFTDRLVHERPEAKKARIKRLKKRMGNIGKTLAKPAHGQDSASCGKATTVTDSNEAKVWQDDEAAE